MFLKVWAKSFICLCLFLFSGGAWVAAQSSPGSPVELSPSPGRYTEDVTIALSGAAQTTQVYYSFVNPPHEKAPLLLFDKPLNLSAVEGEIRDYMIVLSLFRDGELQDKLTFTYIIDKRRPAPPLIAPAPGRYRRDLSLSFNPNGTEAVYYTLGDGQEFSYWDGEALALNAARGEEREIILRCYGVDPQGKKSREKVFSYTIDKRLSGVEPAVTLVSPLRGTYANKQLLVLETSGLRWVKYSLDGTDPLLGNLYWSGPLELDATGDVTLKIAGKTFWDGEDYVRSEVTYTVKAGNTGDNVIFDVPGGYYTSGVTITPTLNQNSIFFYTTDGTSPDYNSERYTSPIQLEGTAGEKVGRDLRLRVLKPNGSLSEVFRHYYIIDQRQLVPPSFRVLTPTRPFRENVKIRVYTPEGTTAYYTTDGSLPEDSRKQATNLISVSGEGLNQDQYLVLMARAFDEQGNGSEVAFLPLPFAPESPASREGEISLPASGKGREWRIPAPGKKQLVYEIKAGGESPADPTPFSPVLDQELLIQVPRGMQSIFVLKTALLGDGQVSDIKEYTCVLDKQPPANPVIRDLPENGLSGGPVTFEFASSSGEIYYQVATGDQIDEFKAELSVLYTLPVTLKGEEGRDLVYHIHAIAVDELGNISQLLEPGILRIDRKPPVPPQEPLVVAYGARIEQKYQLSWEPPEGARFYYRILTPPYVKEEFQLYTASLLIDFSRVDGGLVIECFSQDEVGNSSPRLAFELNPGLTRTRIPVVSGVEDGASYNKPVTLYFLSTPGEVHYELTADGSLPAVVELTSPLAEGPLELDAPQGEERTYRLRARVFHKGIVDVTSRELLISFSVDKKAPEVPRLEGIHSGGYYYTSRELRFAESPDAIYYSLLDREGPGKGGRGQFVPYTGPLELGFTGETSGRYVLTAFAIDAAGNLSPQSPAWEFTIDLDSVYVAPGGDDKFTGTREKPLQTLQAALELCERTDRNVIQLVTGNYLLSRPLVWNKALELRGGFAAGSWQRREVNGRSTITCPADFPSGSALFSCQGGSLRLENIHLRDENHVCVSFAGIERGLLGLKQSLVDWDISAGEAAITLEKATLRIENTEFTASGKGRGSFLLARETEGDIRGSRFSGPVLAEEFVALRLEAGSHFLLREVFLEPGRGRNVTGILSSASRLSVRDSKLATGAGSVTSIAIHSRAGNLDLEQSILNGDSRAGYAVNLLLSDCSARITESVFNIGGGEGATGIKASAGTFLFSGNRVKGQAAAGFLYLVNLKGSRGDFFNNVISGGEASDSLCVLLDNADTRWVHNTIIGGTGEASTTGFLIKNKYKSELRNNILARDGVKLGYAVHLVGPLQTDFILRHNAFAGWEKILHFDYISDSGRSLNFFDPRYAKVDSVGKLVLLDKQEEGGSLEGNIEESFSGLFLSSKQEEYRLAPSSLCVDAGGDISGLGIPGLETDSDGEPRPATGGKPDIGADEYVP